MYVPYKVRVDTGPKGTTIESVLSFKCFNVNLDY